MDSIKLVERLRLSFPLKMEIYAALQRQLPHYPLIVVNSSSEIVFGWDILDYFKTQGAQEVDVLHLELSDKEALLLNYNLKEKFTDLNLYEKLVFIKKILPLAAKEEIYAKTSLDININPHLEQHLEFLLNNEFRQVLMNESVTLKAALGLCAFQAQDRAVLLELFSEIPFSSSHQLKILEMTQEILFRDKKSLRDIFEGLNMSQYMEMEKPQKTIIDAIFKHRNPAAVAGEALWQGQINTLNLPNNMQVTHFPFFEKKKVELTIRLKDTDRLKEILEKLKQLSLI